MRPMCWVKTPRSIAQLEAQYGADVGPGCHRDVQLCGSVGDGDQGDAGSASAPQIANDRRHGHPERRGRQRHEHHGGHRPVDAVAEWSRRTPSTLQSLPPAAASTTPTSTDALTELWFLLTGQTILPTNLGTAVNGYAPFASLFYNTEGLPYFSVGMGNFGVQIAKTLGLIGGAAPAAAKALPGAGRAGRPARRGCRRRASGGGFGRRSLHRRQVVGAGRLDGGACGAPALGHAAIPVSAISAAPEAAGGPGTCSAACPWPVWAAARTPAPDPATDSAPPSWPDHPSPDSRRSLPTPAQSAGVQTRV